VKKSWKEQQVIVVQKLVRDIFLTPEECGIIVKIVWKENQAQVAAILRNRCQDFISFREQMINNMWKDEFDRTGF